MAWRGRRGAHCGIHDVERHAIHEGVVVDGTRVRRSAPECLAVGRARSPYVGCRDRPERHEVDRLHLDHGWTNRVPPTLADLRSLPQPEGDRDGTRDHVAAQVAMEFHRVRLRPIAPDDETGLFPARIGSAA